MYCNCIFVAYSSQWSDHHSRDRLHVFRVQLRRDLLVGRLELLAVKALRRVDLDQRQWQLPQLRVERRGSQLQHVGGSAARSREWKERGGESSAAPPSCAMSGVL